MTSPRSPPAGPTQRGAGRLAGVTQGKLAAIEHGKVDPRLSTVQDIARALRAELVIVPLEALATVRALIGQSAIEEERPLTYTEPDE